MWGRVWLRGRPLDARRGTWTEPAGEAAQGNSDEAELRPGGWAQYECQGFLALPSSRPSQCHRDHLVKVWGEECPEGPRQALWACSHHVCPSMGPMPGRILAWNGSNCGWVPDEVRWAVCSRPSYLPNTFSGQGCPHQSGHRTSRGETCTGEDGAPHPGALGPRFPGAGRDQPGIPARMWRVVKDPPLPWGGRPGSQGGRGMRACEWAGTAQQGLREAGRSVPRAEAPDRGHSVCHRPGQMARGEEAEGRGRDSQGHGVGRGTRAAGRAGGGAIS